MSARLVLKEKNQSSGKITENGGLKQNNIGLDKKRWRSKVYLLVHRRTEKKHSTFLKNRLNPTF